MGTALCLLRAVFVFAFTYTGCALEPTFVRPLDNITVPVGREATFTCSINNLLGHKVAWIKSDTQAILSIDEVVIAHKERLSVVRNDYSTWTMTMRNVRRSDAGSYMCQVNTDPVKHQVAVLEVVVPPDIVTSETSDDVVVLEGGSADLQCRSRGYPEPTITWRREDGGQITVRRHHRTTKEAAYTGETLHLTRVSRAEMGIYLCIASNGIPPLVSKRTQVSVHFAPDVEAAVGLIGAPVGSDITMTCHVEASPRPMYYWTRENGDMLLSGPRHHVHGESLSPYRYRMTLRIGDVTKDDFSAYHCVAKNALGEMQDLVRLQEIPELVRATQRTTLAPPYRRRTKPARPEEPARRHQETQVSRRRQQARERARPDATPLDTAEAATSGGAQPALALLLLPAAALLLLPAAALLLLPAAALLLLPAAALLLLPAAALLPR